MLLMTVITLPLMALMLWFIHWEQARLRDDLRDALAQILREVRGLDHRNNE